MKNWVRWLDEEITVIHRYYKDEGKSIVSRLPRHTWRAIGAKVLHLGLRLQGKKPPDWTQEDLSCLAELRKTKSISELISVFPGRSHNALWLKCERMNFKGSREWSKEEEELLKAHFSNCDQSMMLELLPDRSWPAIKQKAKRFSLSPLYNREEFQRQRMRELNRDQEFTKRRLKALCLKPTKPEQKVINIIQRYNLPYKYVGDGSFIIEGFNPDFINVNGKKHIIEVFGRIWHDTLVQDWHRTELGRIMIYHSYGYRTLIIWDDDMHDENILAQKIVRFDKETQTKR